MVLSQLVLAATLAPTAAEPIQLGSLLVHPRNVLVRVQEGVHPSDLALRGHRVVRWIHQLNIAVVEAPKGQLQATRSRLDKEPWAEWATFDRAAQPAYVPNDPEWTNMWHMTSIKADLAWDISFGSSSAVVAVIDTGVNVSHPDLAANIWVNTDEIPGNNLDDDNNGYVDDINGYDFAYNDGDPNDVFGHGTPCSSIVAGVQDNNIGVTGVAPRAKIMALKASTDPGYFYDSATIPAYMYAVDNGAKVLSMSYFTDDVSPAEGLAIQYCAEHNVLPVAAAGNDSTALPYYPGAYDETLSVAAYAPNGNKSGFSNWGSWVDVAAPGESLRVASVGGGYGGFAGTSGACPHVAGLAALVAGANPTASMADVRRVIEDTATPVNQAPFGEYARYGKINCQAAVQGILAGTWTPRPVSVRGATMLGSRFEDVWYFTDEFFVGRIYGKGFADATNLEVKISGQPLNILRVTRDYVEYEFIPPTFSHLEVYANNALVWSRLMPNAQRVAYPLVDASTPGNGASVTGNFDAALNADAQSVVCTRRNDGVIRFYACVKGVQFAPDLLLRLRRSYSIGSSATERIWVYNWASFSYPYGTWTLLNTGTASATTHENLSISIPNAWDHVDVQGNVYVYIETDAVPSGTSLQLDQLNIATPQ